MANAKPTWLQDKNNENILVPHTLVEMVQDVNGNSLNDLLDDNKISYEVDGERLKIKGGTDASDRHIYSESEHIVGRWTDGKPIYELSFKGTLSGSWQEVDLITNCETLIYNHISVDEGDGIKTSSTYRPWVEDYVCINYITETKVHLYSKNFNGMTYYATIQYTKTTDEPNSEIAINLHKYTSDEKIVGTWVDGKSIYEKTTMLENKTFPNDTWVEVLNTPNIDCIVNKSISHIGNNVVPSFEWQYSNNVLKMNQSRGASVTFSKLYITLQYTKKD